MNTAAAEGKPAAVLGLLCLGSLGDLLPFVAIAQHLLSAGDSELRVRIVSNEQHRESGTLWHYLPRDHERLETRWVGCTVLGERSEGDGKRPAGVEESRQHAECHEELDACHAALRGCHTIGDRSCQPRVPTH